MRDFRFRRELNGYDKQEVDEKLEELFGRIDALTAQTHSLNAAIGQFEEKIRALSESTRRLERERAAMRPGADPCEAMLRYMGLTSEDVLGLLFSL
ncbi:MAG: hypothetical protein LBO81_03630 [Clostridiales Family XIII bacterium]|jgi:cell division septum initiation protein DivIVA|nr:hypothetical protein [Clostridiales Family XIII bacterium]